MQPMQPIHTYSATHILYLISVREFLTLPVKNWQFNRQPDIPRCKEIATHITKTKTPLETIFYLAKNGANYEVLDGIHRYTALKILSAAPVDYITDPMTEIMGSMVLLNIRYDATIGQLIDFFQSLNKSIPVSELYMRDPNVVRNELVENIVQKWQTRYPDHFSTSVKYKRPNMTVDAYKDVIHSMLLQFIEQNYIDPEAIDVECIEDALEQLNNIAYEEWNEKDTPASAIEKCRKTGFWLFMFSKDNIMDHL